MTRPVAAAKIDSARQLLDIVNAAERSQDEAIHNAGVSLRSWLVFSMNLRTIQIPEELWSRYQLARDYYLDTRKRK